jgi:hypothetical protein
MLCVVFKGMTTRGSFFFYGDDAGYVRMTTVTAPPSDKLASSLRARL